MIQQQPVPRGARSELDRSDLTRARHASPLTGIAFVKAALAARLPGFPPYVRPPLVRATDSQCVEIRTSHDDASDQSRTRWAPGIESPAATGLHLDVRGGHGGYPGTPS
ncbi:MAG: hypothetical protein JO281_11975 [Pseudonocardiales bacterium]|nr:hypothetical protein [Pseudonocardiales bacterium]